MKRNLVKYQEKALRAVSGHMGKFYLVGGTALALYYFRHRESVDLDFFTPDFSRVAVENLIALIEKGLNKKAELVTRRLGKNKTKVLIYTIPTLKDKILKIDFVEDRFRLLKPIKVINGVNLLSLEDIYLKKIQAAAGILPVKDIVGGTMFKGGRQEAKDLYDIYCLSSIFMPLSAFTFKYGTHLMREAVVMWFRTYSRFEMKAGLSELEINKKINFVDIERHFKREIDKIIEKEVSFV